MTPRATAANPDKLLPHNDSAEIQVLNAIFAGAERGDLTPLERARRIISPEDFYRSGGAAVFRRCLEFYEAGRPFNRDAIEHSFENEPTHAGISALLDALLPVTGEIVTHYAKIILEISLRRQGSGLTYRAYEKFDNQTGHISAIIHPLLEALESLLARGAT